MKVLILGYICRWGDIMGKKKKVGFIDLGRPVITKQLIADDYFARFCELSMNMFEWTGLPNTIDVRFLELTLNQIGVAGFFFDEVMKIYLALTVMYGGPLNVYNVPMLATAYATNGYQKKLTAADAVLIFNNYLRRPTFPTLSWYAETMAEIEMAIRVNVKAQKTPVIIQTTESQLLTMKNLFKQVDEGEPFIFGDKQIDLTGAKALKTDAPFVADKLEMMKAWYWNEVLTFLGIENSNTQKGERLITDEVKSSLGNTMANRYARLNMRQQACEQINDMFGLNVWVEYKSQPWESAVMKNGEIYDTFTVSSGNELST